MTFVRANILAAVLLVLLSTGAGADGGDSPKVEFLPDGAVITFARPTRVSRVEAWGDGFATDLRPVLSESPPDRPITRYRLFCEVPYEHWYLVRVFEHGRQEPWDLRMPLPGRLDLGVKWFDVALEVPYTGETDVTGRWGRGGQTESFVAPGAEVTASVEVFRSGGQVDGTMSVELPKGIELARSLPDWSVVHGDNGTRLTRPFPEGVPGEIIRYLLPLKVTGREGESLTVTLRANTFLGVRPGVNMSDVGACDVQRVIRLRVASVEKMSETLRAGEVLMPTDAEGELDVRRPRDTLVVPSRLGLAVRRMLGFSEPFSDYYAPSTFQTLSVTNTGAASLPLAVSMRIARSDDNVPAPAFRPPDYLGGGTGAVTVTAEAGPGRTPKVVLPIFTRSAELLPGRYRSIIEVRIFGTDTVAARVEHPFQVRRMDLRALVVTGAAVLASALGLAFFLGRQKKIFSTFRVSELVLIALFAAMTFALVIFPGSILGPLFSAVAGPFAFLIQGLFFEVLRFLVLVTLLVLVPRVGTVTLLSIVRYLIGGLAFGGFTPVDVVYLGASVILMELVLYLAGVTSRRGVLSGRPMSVRSFLYVALVCGVVNGATQYVTWCLNITFYRLYFADWFIWLSVAVNGFLYAALGTLPGLRLGLRLKRVSE